MRDITNKINTLRVAHARAVVKVSESSIEAINNNTVPKGDVFSSARVAALLAVKNTPHALPHCHPMPVEFTEVDFDLAASAVEINVHVKTIYKTGCEIEALYGASVAAMTIYDMLKPIDTELEIGSIKLISKKDGKTDFTEKFFREFTAAVIVISDSVSAGIKEDRSGLAVKDKLENNKINVTDYIVVPNEIVEIQKTVNTINNKGIDIIITTGGTDLSARDVTPKALKPLLDVEVPGIMEACRNYGQNFTPYTMLSRSFAGLLGATLILALPGSVKGASESMNAIFPYILHIFRVIEGRRHE